MSHAYRPGSRCSGCVQIGPGGRLFADYKRAEELRRLMTPNGKIMAIKRARYMGLLPYTSATL